eukprot:2630136-Amphidinium_carterae.1
MQSNRNIIFFVWTVSNNFTKLCVLVADDGWTGNKRAAKQTQMDPKPLDMIFLWKDRSVNGVNELVDPRIIHQEPLNNNTLGGEVELAYWILSQLVPGNTVR